MLPQQPCLAHPDSTHPFPSGHHPIKQSTKQSNTNTSQEKKKKRKREKKDETSKTPLLKNLASLSSPNQNKTATTHKQEEFHEPTFTPEAQEHLDDVVALSPNQWVGWASTTTSNIDKGSFLLIHILIYCFFCYIFGREERGRWAESGLYSKGK